MRVNAAALSVILSDMAQRLCREALVWRQLRHRNVLPFIGLNTSIFPENTIPSLISPWMENGSLRDYIKSSTYKAADQVSSLVCRSVQTTLMID
jgi:serine/threonine protein kinase